MSVLAGCASPARTIALQQEFERDRQALPGTAGTLVSMLPELPIFPEYPLDLDWGYDDSRGLYTLPEQDVDRLLDYRDNSLERYRYELGIYEEEVDSISKRIKDLNL